MSWPHTAFRSRSSPTFWKQARAAGGDVRLCALQDDVRGIFELTRLVRTKSIHPTRREALASWR
jgi:anti-anti-sigma regulatory factor